MTKLILTFAAFTMFALLVECSAAHAQAPETVYYADAYADHYRVPRALVHAIIAQESAWNPLAISKKNAEGLMQLMPSTAAELGVSDSFRPDQNVSGGSTYLDWLLTRYHENLALALAAYNAGPAAVDKYHGIPPYHETQVYVARVIHEFNRRVRTRAAQARKALATATPVEGAGR